MSYKTITLPFEPFDAAAEKFETLVVQDLKLYRDLIQSSVKAESVAKNESLIKRISGIVMKSEQEVKQRVLQKDVYSWPQSMGNHIYILVSEIENRYVGNCTKDALGKGGKCRCYQIIMYKGDEPVGSVFGFHDPYNQYAGMQSIMATIPYLYARRLFPELNLRAVNDVLVDEVEKLVQSWPDVEILTVNPLSDKQGEELQKRGFEKGRASGNIGPVCPVSGGYINKWIDRGAGGYVKNTHTRTQHYSSRYKIKGRLGLHN